MLLSTLLSNMGKATRIPKAREAMNKEWVKLEQTLSKLGISAQSVKNQMSLRSPKGQEKKFFAVLLWTYVMENTVKYHLNSESTKEESSSEALKSRTKQVSMRFLLSKGHRPLTDQLQN